MTSPTLTILADLKESGALFASEEFTHSYPHCWRCKSPIIFRATPQWFCSVESFKDEAVAACDNVKWLPAWGKDRMVAMIRDRADWCISVSAAGACRSRCSTARTAASPSAPRRPSPTSPPCSASTARTSGFEREAMELVPEGLSRSSLKRKAATPGSTARRPTSCPKASPARTAAAERLKRRLTRSTAGLTPARRTLPPCAASIRTSGPRRCISRAPISTAAGSSRAC